MSYDLREGDRVRHESQGLGEIRTINNENGVARVVFDNSANDNGPFGENLTAVGLDRLSKVEPESKEDRIKRIQQEARATLEQYRTEPLYVLATALNRGPDSQDWNDAIIYARDVLSDLDEEEWLLLPKQHVTLLLAALDADDCVDWGHGSTFDKVAESVGFVPVASPLEHVEDSANQALATLQEFHDSEHPLHRPSCAACRNRYDSTPSNFIDNGLEPLKEKPATQFRNPLYDKLVKKKYARRDRGQELQPFDAVEIFRGHFSTYLEEIAELLDVDVSDVRVDELAILLYGTKGDDPYEWNRLRCDEREREVAELPDELKTVAPKGPEAEPICTGCDSPSSKCGPQLWRQQKKCCPDCSHTAAWYEAFEEPEGEELPEGTYWDKDGELRDSTDHTGEFIDSIAVEDMPGVSQPDKTLREKRDRYLGDLRAASPGEVLDGLDRIDREHFDSKRDELEWLIKTENHDIIDAEYTVELFEEKLFGDNQ